MLEPGEFARKPGRERGPPRGSGTRNERYGNKRVCSGALVWSDRNRSKVYLSAHGRDKTVRFGMTGMSHRLLALVVTACLCDSALAQTSAPNLTRQQRELLSAIVTAVDA